MMSYMIDERRGSRRLDSPLTAERVRADNLGSFLRPPYLLEARRNVTGGELRAVEDRAVREVLALQEGVGLPVVTDGEYRRRLFFSTVESIFDGIDPEGYVRTHRDEDGNVEEVRNADTGGAARRGGSGSPMSSSISCWPTRAVRSR